MNDSYDGIILGSGPKECIIACMMQNRVSPKQKDDVLPKKLLMIEPSDTFGSDYYEMDLKKLWATFRPNDPVPTTLGLDSEWHIDPIPKYSLYKRMFKALKEVASIFELKDVDGVYVYQKDALSPQAENGIFAKAPLSERDIQLTNLMDSTQKTNCALFYQFVKNWDSYETETNEGFAPEHPFKDLAVKYCLSANTVDFIGHYLGLNHDDAFKDKPAKEMIEKLQDYFNSIGTYGPNAMIYSIRQMYRLVKTVELAFCKCESKMINQRKIDEILYDDEGKFKGVKSQGEFAYGNCLVAEAASVAHLNKVKSIGKVIRCICIMNHSIAKKDEAHCCQIIMTAKQTGRKSHIHIVSLEASSKVCKKDYYVAVISTMAENDDPQADIKPALDLIGEVLETFMIVSDLYVPLDPSFSDNVFILSSMNASAMIDEDVDDVIAVYNKIPGCYPMK